MNIHIGISNLPSWPFSPRILSPTDPFFFAADLFKFTPKLLLLSTVPRQYSFYLFILCALVAHDRKFPKKEVYR